MFIVKRQKNTSFFFVFRNTPRGKRHRVEGSSVACISSLARHKGRPTRLRVFLNLLETVVSKHYNAISACPPLSGPQVGPPCTVFSHRLLPLCATA
jgi:hypothetical protein